MAQQDTLSAKIGRYHIQQELGRGGMAVVYLGHDPNMNRPVAVKVLPRSLTTESEMLIRFQQEIQLIAALEHPNIVPIYDSGRHEGIPFIIMRYLSGGTLAQRLRGKSVSLTELLRIFTQIATALDEVHGQGIIHRDIKPSNILFDKRGYAFLSDFGIAKMAAGSANLTGVGVIGTPDFMSPEQAMGDKPLNHRSDIYSLGVVLFYALAGQLPFHSTTPMGTALAHINDPVPILKEQELNLPKGCQAIIQRALAKNPQDRFNTAGELAETLAQVIQQHHLITTSALPVTPSNVSILKRGANISLTKTFSHLDNLMVGLGWAKHASHPFDLDASAFMLSAEGKVLSDNHFIFYNNLIAPDNTVQHCGDNRHGEAAADSETIRVNLQHMAPNVQKIVFAVTIYEAEKRQHHFGQIQQAYIRLLDGHTQQEFARYHLDENFDKETAMIFGELYRYKNEWKFRAVGQGFIGGLRALTDLFGVETD